MITRESDNCSVMRRAVRARAAALAGRSVGDVDKDDDAEAEFARLLAIDFSAAMAGKDFVDNLILDGHDVAVAAARKWLPFEMFGLTVGRAQQAANDALNDLWGPQLEKALGIPPSEQESVSLVRDLRTALEGYLYERWGPSPPRPPWWKETISRLRPSSVTIGVNAVFKATATWRFRGRK